MDESNLRELARLIVAPGSVRDADGLAATVLEVRAGDDGLLEVRFAVPPLPDAVVQLVPYAPHDLELCAHALGEDLHQHVTEHVRRHGYLAPSPPPSTEVVDPVARAERWTDLRAEFTDVKDIPGGFTGRLDGRRVTLVIEPDEWHIFADNGVEDACADVHGLVATLDEGEEFLVMYRGDLERSARAELPPVRSGATHRRTREFLRHTAGSRIEVRAHRPGSDQGRDGD